MVTGSQTRGPPGHGVTVCVGIEQRGESAYLSRQRRLVSLPCAKHKVKMVHDFQSSAYGARYRGSLDPGKGR